MFIANDVNSFRVNILDADENETYYCPICGQELDQRRGEIRLHYFAHKRNGNKKCDHWHYDMTEWHRNWQNQFPEECQEVVVTHDGIKHRADILVNGTVIEFQHSKISYKEFNERNEFYTSAGYNLIWLFDMTDEVDNYHIIHDGISRFSYEWKYHWKLFNGFDPELEKKIYVCFQFKENISDGNYEIKHLNWMANDKRRFTVERDSSFDQKGFILFASNYINTYIANKENFNTEKEEGKTLLEIISDCDADVIGVVNIRTGTCAKIGNLNYYRTHNVYKIQGYLGRPEGQNGY